MSCIKPTASNVPVSLFNYSYSTLFPKPHCPKCGHGYTPSGDCVSFEPHRSTLANASLYVSGNCPYGHLQLPGTRGCSDLLAGPFRAPEDSVVVNGHVVQITPTRNRNPVDPCLNTE